MIDLATVERVRAYPCATDMRLGQYGLRKLVMEDEEPRPGTLYLFCSEDRRRIRILEAGDDFVWLHERRARFGRFKWPKRKGGADREAHDAPDRRGLRRDRPAAQAEREGVPVLTKPAK